MKMIILSSILVLTCIVALTGCWSVKKSKPVFRLVDVNEPEYFNDAHIDKAVNLPSEKLDKESKTWNKEDNIVIYCTDYLCSESTRLAKKLQSNGFKSISVYKGGTHEWYQLSLKEPNTYVLKGEASKKYLQRPVEVILPENMSVKVITAEELSKLIK